MRGIVDTYRTYDANGRIIQEQYADGSVMQFIYTLINDTAPQGGLTATKVRPLQIQRAQNHLDGEPE
jgi:hypothetical protein